MSKVYKNWLEWSVFGVGLVLIVALIGYLVYDAVAIGNLPPVIDVELGASESRNGSFLVPVMLTNQGDETAENVTVEVVLLMGEEEVETAEISFDFIPRDSSRSGWVTFTTDPRSVDEMQPHVLGYMAP